MVINFVPDPSLVALNGDVDDNGKINIEDVTLLISYLINNDSVQINQANADVDGDGVINISDVTGLIEFLLNKH